MGAAPSNSRSGLLAGWLAALLLSTAPRAARGQEDDAARRAAGQALFDQASALIDKHDYRAACPKLEEVARLQPGKVGTMMALGECYEGAGRVASAWTQYRAAADRAAALQDSRAAAAQAKVAALAPKLPRLGIQVDAATKDLPGLEVKRDGIPVGAAQWGEPMPVDPGEHVIEAQALGREPLRVVVEIKEGEAKDAAVTLLPRGPAAAPRRDAPPAKPPPASGSGRRTAGLVVGGAGLAGLGVGGLLGIVTILKNKDANATVACSGPATLPNVTGCNALRDAARGMQTGGIVAAVVGGVALGTGAAVFATAPREGKPLAGAAVVVHPTGAFLVGQF
jgi:hypothetical protein